MSIDMPKSEVHRDESSLDCIDYIKKCESNSAKLVVLYLSINGSGVSVDQISEEFDMKKINIIPVLQNLQDKEIIKRTNNRYTLS